MAKQKLKILICIFSAGIFLSMPLFSNDNSECYNYESKQKGFMSYHGKRMKPELSDFCVVKIKAEKIKSNRFAITFVFNVPIDPRTVQNKFIKINGKPLSEKTKIIYNKEGTALRLMFPKLNTDFYSIDIGNILSFNGAMLKTQHFENINDGYNVYFGKE